MHFLEQTTILTIIRAMGFHIRNVLQERITHYARERHLGHVLRLHQLLL